MLKISLKVISFFLLFFIIFLFFFNNSFSFMIGEKIEYTMLPVSPSSFQRVHIDLKTNFFDLNSSEISFYKNNKLIQKEYGKKDFSFKTGKIGEKIKIQIKVKKFNEETVEREITIIPAEVFLTYQVLNPYRPFNYQGKSLALSNSALNIYSFTNFKDENGRKIPKEELIFNWYVNFEFERRYSGLGRDVFRIHRLNAHPRETDIRVKVYNKNRIIMAQRDINFSPQRTRVQFYLIEDESLPFSFRNIANPSLKTNELDARIYAVPFFMNNVLRDTRIEWRVNNKRISTGRERPLEILLFNNPDNLIRESRIFLRIRNQNRILQSTERGALIEFIQRDDEEDRVFFDRRDPVIQRDGFGIFGL